MLSDSIFLRSDGKTYAEGFFRAFCALRIATACVESGTRNSCPAFILIGGIVHVEASQSISSHVVHLASPLLSGRQDQIVKARDGGGMGFRSFDGLNHALYVVIGDTLKMLLIPFISLEGLTQTP